MTDPKEHNLNVEEGGIPSGEELAVEGEAFLAAVDRAKKMQTKSANAAAQRSPALSHAAARNRAWQAAALLLAASVSVVVLLVLRPTSPVVALSQSGVNGIITNNATHRVQQGVVFRQADAAGSGAVACISDAMGAFALPAPASTAGQAYDYSFGGKALGSLVVGPQPTQVSGVAHLSVHIPKEELHLSAGVALHPGETVSGILPRMSVSLDAGAPGPWSGTLRYDTDWPACFCYGRVLDGIVRLEGPAVEGLNITMEIDPEALSVLDGRVEDLELITHDDSYADPGSEHYGASGLFPPVDRQFHHGWYVTDKPYGPLARMPSLALAQTAGTWSASWSPVVGRPYALLLKQRDQGQPTAAWLGEPRSGTDEFSYTAIVGLLHPRALDNSLYHFRFRFEDGSERDFGSYPDIYNSYKLFGATGDRSEARAADPIQWAFPTTSEGLVVPGNYLVYLMDFTLCSPYLYPPVPGDFSQPPDDLRLEIESHGLGQVAHCEVVGRLPALDGRIEWDLHQDGLVDGYDSEFEFPVPCVGSYIITASIPRRNGIPMLLRRSLNLAPACVIGYLPLSSMDQPVIRAAAEPPMEAARIRYMSITSSSRPAELAWLAGPYAGPSMYLDLPEQFRNAPLKELRVYLTASPRGGDNDSFAFTPQIQFVQQVTYGAQYPFDYGCDTMPSGGTLDDFTPETWVGIAGSRMHEAFGALAAHQRNPVNGAVDYYKNDIAHRTSAFINETTLALFGFDPRDPPGEEEIVARIEAVRDSPRCCWMFTTKEEQDSACRLDLFGTRPPKAAVGMIFTLLAETQNVLKIAQWDLYSGPQHLSRLELETLDGKVLTRYFDYRGYQTESIGSTVDRIRH